MRTEHHSFSFDVYDNIGELPSQDQWLLNEAREVTATAYAPYSRFQVGAVALLANGEVVAGSNQENASFPVGLCAERVLLASVSSLYPGVPIDTIAISYFNNNGESDRPITPCGVCRQSLCEFESRVGRSIRLILGGMEGEVFVVPSSGSLLPMSFSGDDLA
jgi:cytidine deaminase